MIEEMMVLVDENDQQLGLLEKTATHQQGKLHRAFSVFLFRLCPKDHNVIEILLQQRHIGKYHCGGLWTNACCSHPREGESLIMAGKRRMQEELLLSTELQHVDQFIYKAEFTNGLIEHELDHVLVGIYNDEVSDYNNTEVQAMRWISLEELDKDLRDKADSFTPWFERAYRLTQSETNKAKLKKILNKDS